MAFGKYILSAVISGIMFASTAAAADDFSDVASEFWAGSEIEYLADEGVISGYEDGTFRPSEPVTRSQAATIIIEAFHLETTERPEADFTDIGPGYYAYETAAAVQDEGIINGNNGRFMPNDVLTRGQMAAVLNRASEDIAYKENQIDYRNANEPFETMEELDNVSYIGQATIEEMRPEVTFG